MSSCLHCGCDTKNPKFCSRSCSAKVTNLTPKRTATPRFCKSCGVTVPARRTKCNSCITPDMTIQEAMYTHLHKSSAFALIRTRARSAVKDRKKVCMCCGYNKHVEVCHIKAVSSYPNDTLLSEVNDPSNLVLLCPNCHWEFDHMGLDLTVALSS